MPLRKRTKRINQFSVFDDANINNSRSNLRRRLQENQQLKILSVTLRKELWLNPTHPCVNTKANILCVGSVARGKRSRLLEWICMHSGAEINIPNVEK